MSKLIVEVCKVDKVQPHTNADKLEIVTVKGWQLVVPKGQMTIGDKVVYFPPDTILPMETSEKFGVTKYLSKGRIKPIKLRGEPSYGLAMPVDDPSWPVGKDVAQIYGATKFMPPIRASNGDAEVDHPLFERYTEIENMRNFPNVFTEGEEVILTEKIHGTNCRVGLIEGEWMAGSHNLRRKKPLTLTAFQRKVISYMEKYPALKKLPLKKLKFWWAHRKDNIETDMYWFPTTIPAVRGMLESMLTGEDSGKLEGPRQIVLFGEVFGPGVQKKFDYGITRPQFRVFDMLVDGHYVNHSFLENCCNLYGVEMVPEVARIPYNIDQIRKLSGGKTLLNGQPHIREGVVVRPVEERRDPLVGRVILKYISDEYLVSKNGEDDDFTEV